MMPYCETKTMVCVIMNIVLLRLCVARATFLCADFNLLDRKLNQIFSVEIQCSTE
jgi:hypothetical protein